MSAHALLSPSSAKRWIACTPSAVIERQFSDKGSVFADEGTLAHRLAEAMMLFRLNRISGYEYDAERAEIAKHELYKHEMVSYVENYCDYIWEHWCSAKSRNPDAEIFTERKVDLTEYVPEGFGTIDISIMADHWLTIIDLKYGKGVPVSALENDQLMIYALGALRNWNMLFEITHIRMVIYQPRLDSISVFEISVEELLAWANNVLAPAAQKAIKGEGELVAGEHCRFCRAKPTCAALAAYNLELAKYDFMPATSLDAQQIADILSRAAMFTNWLNAVEEYALDQAVNHGAEWPGYKIVRGRANRAYKDREKIIEVLEDSCYGPEIYEPAKLIGLTAMEGLLGKKTFAALLNPYIIKPEGKPTLVPLSDKRIALNSAAAAAADFMEADAELLD